MQEKLLKIINTYGVLEQLKYFQTEIFEFNEAIIGYELFEDYVSHITEEMADIMVMLKQFQCYYSIKDEEINKIMEYKINRQIDRINKSTK